MDAQIKHHNSPNSYSYITSHFILKQILSHLKEKNLLKLIKHNKAFQNILNIGVKDYKDYNQVIIELTPVQYFKEKNYFFKYNYSSDESAIHIFFNDDTEDKSRNYFNKEDKVTKIKMVLEWEVITLYELFLKCQCITKIKFIKFNRSTFINMSYMLEGCYSLEKIDLSNFNTKNVTDMQGMFKGCWVVEKLDLSKFDTNKVTNMYRMFSWCNRLTEVNLSSFDTFNVENMSFMFYECWFLKELNISNFSTNSVTNMEGMFIQCTQLKDLEFYFDLEKDVNMFNECDEQLKKKVIKLNKKNKMCNVF